MELPKRCKVAAVCGDGRIRLIDHHLTLRPGTVMVEVHTSLVSPGSEVGGWRGLAERVENPEPDAEPRPFGYSNAGVVLAVGDGVGRFAVGDRIACIGGGYALHAEYAVVPHNLCFLLPEAVSYGQGAYAMLAGTAVHALRRGEAEFGEFAAVAGLGLLGQLTAQMLKLAGCFVVGWDMIPRRLEIAAACGVEAVVDLGTEDAVDATRAFTAGAGIDLAVIAFGGDATTAMDNIAKCLKVAPDSHRMGRIVIVGRPEFEWPFRPSFNVDIRQAGRTGPGYHDEAWESGEAYPPVFMRWTTTTNLELCMRLLALDRLQVDALTTHTVPFEDVEEGVAEISRDPDSALGVVFAMR